ncbi:MAG: CocE/NonD family hydrolase [Actinobacteria bacterium]|nr:CocE/NonD family hydrolase [Actinomycetota bacterium]
MRQLPRRMIASVVAGAVSIAAAACSPPPPLDLSETSGPYGVAVTRDLSIPLPDGRVLRADLYEPTAPLTNQRLDGPFPVIIGFTPYGKSGATTATMPGANGVNLSLVRNGYLALAVDIPGTGASEGAFNLFDRAEAVAGAGVVRWAAELPRSSGSVGMLGLSYMAIVQLFTAAEVGPSSPLKAIFPMSATVDAYRDLFVSGGALNLISPLGLLFGYGVTRVTTPFTELSHSPFDAIRRSLAHLGQMGRFEAVMAADMFSNGPRRYDGAWWAERRVERILGDVVDNGVAVFLVGGQYDVFQRGVPLIYSGLQNAAAGQAVSAPMTDERPVSDRFQMLTGPWTHANLGEGLDLTAIQIAWFDRWLKGDGTADASAPQQPVHIVESGGNEYRAATYPLADASVQRWWLRRDGALAQDPPSGDEPADSVTYNPLGPTCTASTVQFSAGLNADECLGRRVRSTVEPNEVVYVSEPFAEDVQLAGPIGVTLHATSTRRETLFTVVVEDVGADGASMDLTGGAVLGSLRAVDPERSWPSPHGGWLRPYHPLTRESATPVPIGESVRYDIEVRPVFATIPAGHRLRIRIGTADFPHLVPLADRASLFGGRYEIEHRLGAESFIDLSVRTRLRSEVAELVGRSGHR